MSRGGTVFQLTWSYVGEITPVSAIQVFGKESLLGGPFLISFSIPVPMNED